MQTTLSKFLFFSIILCSVFSSLHSQEKDYMDLKPLKRLEKGDRFFNKEDYASALELYRDAWKNYPGDPAIEKRIAISLARFGNFEEAIPMLENLRTLSDTVDVFVNYHLAESYQSAGQFGQAAEAYQSCKDYAIRNSNEYGLEKLQKKIDYCSFRAALENDKKDYRITRPDSGINSKFPEYGARVFMPDSFMLFTSQRKSGLTLTGFLQKKDEDIYAARFKNGKWEGLKPLSSVNTMGNEAVLDISSDGKKAYIYVDDNQGDIMVIYLDSVIQGPFPLRGQINSGFHENSISMHPSGNVCYFTSNRTDYQNEGGQDIFIATRDSGGDWTNIKNLGSELNTSANEDFVYYSPGDSSLYFSSDRQPGVGGYDIYISRLDFNGRFRKAVNLGVPVNTEGHDIHFAKYGRYGWYSRTDDGLAEDIYKVDFDPSPYNENWHTINVPGIQKIKNYRVVKDIHFSFSSSKADPQSPEMKALIKYLKEAKTARVRLTGYSDWVDDASFNNRISFERMSHVAEVLIDHGISSSRLVMEARGELDLLTDTVFSNLEDQIEAQKYNRRVQIEIIEQSEPYIHVSHKKIPSRYQSKNYLEREDTAMFGVMIYVSGVHEPEYLKSGDFREFYLPGEDIYCYMPDNFYHPEEAEKYLHEIKKDYPGAYLFAWE